MRISQKQGMIILLIIMLSSSLTTFTTTKPRKQARIIIKFNNYEVYSFNTTINNNTLLQAVSEHYPVTIKNTLCIRNECDDNKSKWLIYNYKGEPISINQTIKQSTYYLIYNTTIINYSSIINP